MYKKIRHDERPFVLHIFVGEDAKAIAVRLNTTIKGKTSKFVADDFKIGEDAAAMTYDLSDKASAHFCIVFRNFVTIGDIVHEATHCVARHFRYVQQPLEESSEESYAYMMEWVTLHLFKMIYGV